LRRWLRPPFSAHLGSGFLGLYPFRPCEGHCIPRRGFMQFLYHISHEWVGPIQPSAWKRPSRSGRALRRTPAATPLRERCGSPPSARGEPRACPKSQPLRVGRGLGSPAASSCPLFTGVRGREILRSSNPESCIGGRLGARIRTNLPRLCIPIACTLLHDWMDIRLRAWSASARTRLTTGFKVPMTGPFPCSLR
jgi:hypothetical protein